MRCCIPSRCPDFQESGQRVREESRSAESHPLAHRWLGSAAPSCGWVARGLDLRRWLVQGEFGTPAPKCRPAYRAMAAADRSGGPCPEFAHPAPVVAPTACHASAKAWCSALPQPVSQVYGLGRCLAPATHQFAGQTRGGQFCASGLVKRLQPRLRTAQDQGMYIMRAFVGVHGLQIDHVANDVVFVMDAIAAVHVARHAGNV